MSDEMLLEDFKDTTKKKNQRIPKPSEILTSGTCVRIFQDGQDWIVQSPTLYPQKTIYILWGVSGFLGFLGLICLFKIFSNFILFTSLAAAFLLSAAYLFLQTRIKWQIRFSYDFVEITKEQIGTSVYKVEFPQYKRAEILREDLPDIFGYPVAVITEEDRFIIRVPDQESQQTLYNALQACWHYFKQKRYEAGELEIEAS